MSEPITGPRPKCPLHQIPMIFTATVSKVEKFHCSKCSCEIERDIKPNHLATPENGHPTER